MNRCSNHLCGAYGGGSCFRPSCRCLCHLEPAHLADVLVAQIRARREDDAFMDRLVVRMREDRPLLDRLQGRT